MKLIQRWKSKEWRARVIKRLRRDSNKHKGTRISDLATPHIRLYKAPSHIMYWLLDVRLGLGVGVVLIFQFQLIVSLFSNFVIKFHF